MSSRKTSQSDNYDQLSKEELIALLRKQQTREMESTALLSAVPDLIFHFDLEGNVLSFHSFRTEELYLRPEAFIGKSIFEVLPPDVSYALRKAIKDLVDTGTMQSFEYRLPMPEGERVYEARITLSAELSVVTICRDVTEAKASQEQLKYQRSLLHAQHEAAPDGILVVSQDKHILSVNQRFKEMWGVSEEEMSKNSDTALLSAVLHSVADPEGFIRNVSDIYADPNAVEERDVYLRDGRVFERHTRPVKSSDGEIYGRIWFFRDITDRKNAEQTIREQQNQIEIAMDIAGMGDWCRDFRTQTVTWSAGVRKIFGLGPDQHIHDFKDFIACVHPEDRELVTEMIERSIASAEATDFFYRVVRPDHEVRWVHARNHPFYDQSGRVHRMVGIARDITKEREQLRLLFEQNARMLASSKLSSLGEMAGSIAHEINNPLAIIAGRAGQLKDASERGEIDVQVLGRAADTIQKTATRISKIIRGLRTFARDGDKDPFVSAPLNTMIQDTLELCRERFRIRQIDLQVELLSESIIVECRQVQISQVLVNLLNNAFDAVEGKPESWVKLSVADRETHVEISIADSGPGIPKELREKIFQPFFTTKEVGKGTGLGLSISIGILAQHKGSLFLDERSTQNTFVIRLPKSQSLPLMNAA